MKVYISIDMEGISSIVHPDEVAFGQSRYEWGRTQMTADCNAAIEGVIAAGATTVVVNEAHGQMRNLRTEELHPAAVLIRGYTTAQCMVEGLDSSFDAALFVGYHGKAGANGVLSHSFMGKDIYAVKVNGKVVGELEIAALIAGAHDVPVVMVTGDDVVCRDAQELLGQEVVTVPVKRSLDRFAAECLHPTVAREAIRAGAARSLAVRDRVARVPLASRYEVVLDLLAPTQAWICGCMPGVERTGDRQVTYVAQDARQIFPFLMAAMVAARGVTDLVY